MLTGMHDGCVALADVHRTEGSEQFMCCLSIPGRLTYHNLVHCNAPARSLVIVSAVSDYLVDSDLLHLLSE